MSLWEKFDTVKMSPADSLPLVMVAQPQTGSDDPFKEFNGFVRVVEQDVIKWLRKMRSLRHGNVATI